MKSLPDRRRCSASRSTIGLRWKAALPTQSARTARCRSRPDRAKIWLWRYNGRWSAYLLTNTCASVASVGRPPGIRCAAAGAWVTPSVQPRQAYFGRMVTMTRSCAGTMSRRSVRSSPIRCSGPQPQGQFRLSGSITTSMRGSAAGRLPMVRRGAGRGAVSSVLVPRSAFSASTSARATDSSSKASCRSSSESFSDRLPCRAWFSSAIRCSCLRVISRSAVTSSINASAAARCATGRAERSRAGAVGMG